VLYICGCALPTSPLELAGCDHGQKEECCSDFGERLKRDYQLITGESSMIEDPLEV